MMESVQESLISQPQPIKSEDSLDLKDLKQALNQEVQKVQQRLAISQNQIADNCKNGAPPKQLLLYLVR